MFLSGGKRCVIKSILKIETLKQQHLFKIYIFVTLEMSTVILYKSY